nr:uncharacterized protein LOC111419558 [Onthophagus taurus]
MRCEIEFSFSILLIIAIKNFQTIASPIFTDLEIRDVNKTNSFKNGFIPLRFKPHFLPHIGDSLMERHQKLLQPFKLEKWSNGVKLLKQPIQLPESYPRIHGTKVIKKMTRVVLIVVAFIVGLIISCCKCCIGSFKRKQQPIDLSSDRRYQLVYPV